MFSRVQTSRLLIIVAAFLMLNLVSMLIALLGGIWWPLMLTVASVTSLAAVGLVGFSIYRDVVARPTPPISPPQVAVGNLLRQQHTGSVSSSETVDEAHQTSPQSIYSSGDVTLGALGQPVYSGDPLDNKVWVNVVEECVALFDEMDRLGTTVSEESRDLAEHVCDRLREILERSGVEVLEGSTEFDRRLHQLYGEAVRSPDGTAVTRTISPGFRVGRRIFRRARVTIN
jgi:hypothetical protein